LFCALVAGSWQLAAPRAAAQPVVRVSGKVVRGTRAGPQPAANVAVILHRVGNDRAGPLDSVRTTTAGTYAFSYRPSGDSAAIYFASASYGGVAYFTPPFRSSVIAGDDATITVFDTTSGPVAIKLGGRHLIIGAPQASGRRPIGEVYDLENDTTVTAVAHDTTPVWSVHLPPGAVAFQVNSSASIGPRAVAQRGSVVGLFAPISPGVRQFAFTYELPANAFPLNVPLERNTGVLEVMVQEPMASLGGVSLKEVAPVSTEGRTFRRFVAEDVAPGAVLRVSMPRFGAGVRTKVIIGVLVFGAIGMFVAATYAVRRRALYIPRPSPLVARPSEGLLRAIAALDAAFERQTVPSALDRQTYDARRAALKQQLADALAADRAPT
jgi:hypothetical protein